MITYGDEECAIRFAQGQEKAFHDKKFSMHNPCTTVYKLVRLLRGEDQAFNQMLMDDMEMR